MKFLNTLASYVPGIIVEQLQSQQEQEVPFRKAYKTVVVFCDISGFTKLSEHMARSGKGAEGVSRNLNKYFQMMVRSSTNKYCQNPYQGLQVQLILGRGARCLFSTH